MRGVLGIAAHHAIAGARRKATSGLHDRRSSSLSRMAYMLLDSVRRELLGESPISNSEECGAHSPDRSLCSMKLRLRFFLPAKSANSFALPETGVTVYTGDMGDTCPFYRRGHALEGVSHRGRTSPLRCPPAGRGENDRALRRVRDLPQDGLQDLPALQGVRD